MIQPFGSGNAELAYRAYLIGNSGRIEAATPLRAENDEDAIEQTRRLVEAHAMELWDRGRLVMSLSPCRRC